MRFFRIALTLGVVLIAGLARADAPRATVSPLEATLVANPIGTASFKLAHVAVTSGVIVEIGEVRASPLHRHRLEDHVFYVIRGRATARLGDETRVLNPGDLVNIPRGVAHSVERTGSEPFVILAVVTDGWDVKKDTELAE